MEEGGVRVKNTGNLYSGKLFCRAFCCQ